jgi:hypothetical protein
LHSCRYWNDFGSDIFRTFQITAGELC